MNLLSYLYSTNNSNIANAAVKLLTYDSELWTGFYPVENVLLNSTLLPCLSIRVKVNWGVQQKASILYLQV